MPDYAYHLLLGLYLPIVICGSILNTILLAVILSTPKLRIDPRCRSFGSPFPSNSFFPPIFFLLEFLTNLLPRKTT
jgi:hypothetical protein